MVRQGTISKDRIKKNGEVFTPDEIVNDMHDLLDKSKNGVINLDSTYLEPTCGDGAILVRILDRKLGLVQSVKDAGGDWREALLKAVASIYGVDITADNVVMSKRRMLDVIENGETAVLSLAEETPVKWQSQGFELSDELRELIKLILDYNIQCGNLLTGEQYKIYCTGFSCWNCNINLVDEKHIYRHKVDDKNKELPGWETQKSTLLMTQWKFDGTKYINRQCTFNDYRNYMVNGQAFMYYKTEKLALYCKHVDPKDDVLEDYDF